MRKALFIASLATVVPLGFSSAALAQAPAPSKVTSEDAGTYTLKGVAPSSSLYELSGTSISGAPSTTQFIMTAPVEQGAPLKFENGVHLYPSLFTGIGYNDNLLSDATNSTQSSFINLAPKLVAEMKRKGDRYTALVSVNDKRYSASSPDNTTDSQFSVAGDNYFSARARAGWSLGVLNGTDVRGANNRPLTAEAARYHSNNINGRFIYGAPEAPGRFEFDAGNVDKVYDTERATTAVGDVSTGSYAGRVFYRLGTRSLALAEFRSAKNNYSSVLSTDSNVERRYYAGITWEATAATTGIIKVGQMTKDFDQAGKQGFSGGSWEASVRWLPLTYSAVDLQTSRAAADASGFGNYNLVTSTDITWSHKWTQSVGSRLSLGQMNTDFGGTARQDSAMNYGLKLDYAVYRWLKVGVDIAGTDSTSNVAGNEFKRNITMLTLDATL